MKTLRGRRVDMADWIFRITAFAYNLSLLSLIQAAANKRNVTLALFGGITLAIALLLVLINRYSVGKATYLEREILILTSVYMALSAVQQLAMVYRLV